MLLHMLPKVELYVFSQSSCLLFTYSCWDFVFGKVVMIVMIISVVKVCHAMVRLKILGLFLIWLVA